jgi:LuxR family transcriptional regulator, maltose regulon positive regulatory protein
MSSEDGMLALFTDYDATQAPDCSVVPGLATVDMRLEEASRLTLQLERLLSDCSHSQVAHYLNALRLLQACILAAKDDDLTAAHRVLSLCLSAALAFDRLQLTVCANLAIEALGLARLLYHALPADDAQLLDLRTYIATLPRSDALANFASPSQVTCRTLSRRETGILQLIANGMSNKRIAQSLGIAPETVKSHAKNIFIKLRSRTRAQAVAHAQANGLL